LAYPQLAVWQNFYMIVGSSGAALIGIQFIVITLVAELSRRTSADTVGAFGTPNVAHFGSALVISCIMSIPWTQVFPLAIVLGVCGVGGFLYSMLVIHRARRQTVYEPASEDWLWYHVFPCILYAVLILAAFWLRTRPNALFVIAIVALGLLLIGIHNAWDSVTYIVIDQPRAHSKKKE